MKALLCKQHGLPDSLVLEDLPDPLPGHGEVVVDMKAAGVNFPDVLIIQDKYQVKPPLPFSPGAELAGTIAAVGPGVEGFSVGDRVIASTGHGAFAEKVKAAADRLIPLPDSIDFDVGAAFVLTYGTSWHAIRDRAALQPGETLLVLGAAGGVGLAAIEIGKASGATVIAAASSPDKLAACRAHGADSTIDYASEDLRERIKALTGGKGPDVVYDPVGGAHAEPAFRSIAWRGRYLVVGFASGEIPRLPLNLALLKGAAIIGGILGDYTAREPAGFRRDLQSLFDLVGKGRLKPHISARYPLARGAEALDDMMNRRVIGKVVITR